MKLTLGVYIVKEVTVDIPKRLANPYYQAIEHKNTNNEVIAWDNIADYVCKYLEDSEGLSDKEDWEWEVREEAN